MESFKDILAFIILALFIVFTATIIFLTHITLFFLGIVGSMLIIFGVVWALERLFE